MSKNLLKAIAFNFALFSFIIGLTHEATGYVGKSSASEAKISDESRISIALVELGHALDNTNFDPAEIRVVFALPEREQALETIGDIHEDGINWAVVYDSKSVRQIYIIPHSIDEDNEMYTANFDACFRMNNYCDRKSYKGIFKIQQNTPILINGMELLNEIRLFLNQSRINMAPYAAEDKTEVREKSSYLPGRGISSLILIKTLFHNSSYTVPRFNRTESREIWGHTIFARPYDILPLKMTDVLSFDYNIMICSDPGAQRIIGNDEISGGWVVMGSYGDGPYNFRQPHGITNILPNAFCIADAYNSRASIYELDVERNEANLEFVNSIVKDGSVAFDVAFGYIYDSVYCTRELAVLDSKNSQVDIYDVYNPYTCIHRTTLLSNGSGYMQIDKPRSICYGKLSINCYDYQAVYIADAGNNRIVRVGTGPSGGFTESNFAFPEEAYISSVDVDNFGYVYAVDNTHGMVYMFTPGLQDLLATFGGHGTGDEELYFPVTFKIAKGWYFTDYDWHPYVLGDAFITEYFGNETGIRRYNLANKIRDYGITFFPRGGREGYDVLRFEWVQSGATSSSRKVYYEGALIQNEYESLNLPGTQYAEYWSADSLEEGYYTFEVTMISIFDITAQTSIRDSIFIVRSS